MWLNYVILFCFTIAVSCTHHFTVPETKIQAYKSGGLRVSVPDAPGFQLFAFHGNVNEPLHKLEAGQMSRDILKPHHGRWIFEDPSIRLKLNDVIYYWIYVQVDGLGYSKTNQYWIVTHFEGEREESRFVPLLKTISVPDAKLEALRPEGLRVSIPDMPGMELFAFHGNVNEKLPFLAAGKMSKDIVERKNGRWTFEDESVKLEKGDVLYYWLYIIVNGRGYRKDNQTWTVTGYTNDADNEAADLSTTTQYQTEDNDSVTHITTTQISPDTTTVGNQPVQFPAIEFTLPEGMELQVVVKDGKLLLKNPLPDGMKVESNQTAVIGYCKLSHICLPAFITL